MLAQLLTSAIHMLFTMTPSSRFTILTWLFINCINKSALAAKRLSYNGLAQTPQMGWVSDLGGQ